MAEIFEPHAIEKRSMEIITSELNGRTWPEPTFSVVRRCIHTSADFDYADNLRFSDKAVELGVKLMRSGVSIVTDTMMAFSGINKNRLESYGGKAYCFIKDPDVIEEAKRRDCTRATVSMEKAAKLEGPVIFAIGNAPTALIRIAEMIEEGMMRPALVIGAPVGFVNVVESKERIMEAGVPFIVPAGRKGGSNIAATICNAMLYYNGEIDDA
ncbi:MAG: precorrin-8X methylmutase [Candidatus Methanomethylophilaceae archaeon]